ncbi:hypothetical protein B0H14DRAFT_2647409 [Mycena olivaceomarginata]|nr:hypothetical protein B0H14DRAFT_2647409 [Mycena olivaceomarginata]
MTERRDSEAWQERQKRQARGTVVQQQRGYWGQSRSAEGSITAELWLATVWCLLSRGSMDSCRGRGERRGRLARKSDTSSGAVTRSMAAAERRNGRRVRRGMRMPMASLTRAARNRWAVESDSYAGGERRRDAGLGGEGEWGPHRGSGRGVEIGSEDMGGSRMGERGYGTQQNIDGSEEVLTAHTAHHDRRRYSSAVSQGEDKCDDTSNIQIFEKSASKRKVDKVISCTTEHRGRIVGGNARVRKQEAGGATTRGGAGGRSWWWWWETKALPPQRSTALADSGK